jgi:hypothetical protein
MSTAARLRTLTEYLLLGSVERGFRSTATPQRGQKKCRAVPVPHLYNVASDKGVFIVNCSGLIIQ